MSETIFQQQTIPVTPEDWTDTVPFNQFDPSAGTLLSADFTTTGIVVASAAIENLAPVAASVALNLNDGIVASAPGLGVVGSIDPEVTASVDLGAHQGAFDGTVNFRSPSGTIITNLSGTASDTTDFNVGPVSPASLPTVGSGTFGVTVSSSATSTVIGNGNLAVLSEGGAGAVIALDYQATPPMLSAGSTGIANSGSIGTLSNSGTIGGGIFTYVTTAPQTVVLPSQTSGWTEAASFNQFDPALGTLAEVILTVENTITGTFSAENLENTAASVSMNEDAVVSVKTHDLVTSSTASASDLVNLPAFQGKPPLRLGESGLDFTGHSARSDTILANPAQDKAGSAYLEDGADLAAFTGTGTIALPVSSLGYSVVTGPADLYSELTQQTGATIAVSYVYATTRYGGTTSGVSGTFGTLTNGGTIGFTGSNDSGCLAQGTRIATAEGETPVECFAVGQMVTLEDGRASPVVWIGWRDVDCRRHPAPEKVWPVRIKAGAFRDGVPSRDLMLSPDHAVFIDDVLIPARHLIDGTAIVQLQTDRVRYFHVELAEHEILLAESLPVESFLDTGVRHQFANGGAAISLHPNFTPLIWETSGRAPLVQSGPLLAAARQRLAARAALCREAA
jgi:collagen type I/II/III/V/XI/XXIV/XXVII alpha